MYVPSEDRLIILHKSIRKRLCPFELVSQRKMRGPKEDNKFCRLTPWYTLDVPGSVTIIRQKKLLPRHGHICMTCKLENQPVRGVFLRKKFFFIKILKKIYKNLLQRLTSVRCKWNFISLKLFQEFVNTILKDHPHKGWMLL